MGFEFFQGNDRDDFESFKADPEGISLSVLILA